MNDSFVWTDTNSKNRIIVNEQIEVKLLDNLEEKKTKIEAKIQYLFLSFADSEDGYRCEYYCHWKSWSWKEYNLELHCWRSLVQGNNKIFPTFTKINHFYCPLQSGISIGLGLTYKLDVKQNNNGKFYDTPGLADEELRKKAGEAISSALKEGGKKIVYFVQIFPIIKHIFDFREVQDTFLLPTNCRKNQPTRCHNYETCS